MAEQLQPAARVPQTVVHLRQELKLKGLSTHGRKAELTARLQHALEEEKRGRRGRAATGSAPGGGLSLEPETPHQTDASGDVGQDAASDGCQPLSGSSRLRRQWSGLVRLALDHDDKLSWEERGRLQQLTAYRR